MIRSVVLVYFSRLRRQQTEHQSILLDADAQAIAELRGCDFEGIYHGSDQHSGHIVFVRSLLVDDAADLGICSQADFFGGVVPHALVKTKAVTHGLVGGSAERPEGWSDRFAERVSGVVLPSYTVFSARDTPLRPSFYSPRGRCV
jgi:hypothetical protein